MSRRYVPFIFFGLLVTAVTIGAALAGDPAPAAPPSLRVANRTCPVQGLPVDPKLTAVWNGLEVSLCCPECVPAFQKEPQRYAAALVRDLALQLAEAKSRIAVQQPPGTNATPPAVTDPKAAEVVDLANPVCPVMGGKAKESVFTTYHGMKIRFCCPGCDRRFQADPAKYLQVLRKDPKLAPAIDRAEAQHGGHGHN